MFETTTQAAPLAEFQRRYPELPRRGRNPWRRLEEVSTGLEFEEAVLCRLLSPYLSVMGERPPSPYPSRLQ